MAGIAIRRNASLGIRLVRRGMTFTVEERVGKTYQVTESYWDEKAATELYEYLTNRRGNNEGQ